MLPHLVQHTWNDASLTDSETGNSSSTGYDNFCDQRSNHCALTTKKILIKRCFQSFSMCTNTQVRKICPDPVFDISTERRIQTYSFAKLRPPCKELETLTRLSQKLSYDKIELQDRESLTWLGHLIWGRIDLSLYKEKIPFCAIKSRHDQSIMSFLPNPWVIVPIQDLSW